MEEERIKEEGMGEGMERYHPVTDLNLKTLIRLIEKTGHSFNVQVSSI